MLYPSLKKVENLCAAYCTVPVFASRLMDTRTPVGIFGALKDRSKTCFLLESVDNSQKWGRYSFIGINPKAEITISNGEAVICSEGGERREKIGNPANFLSAIIENHRSPVFEGYPRFTGGLAGYFGYDMLRYLETKLHTENPDDIGLPDCMLGLYDEVIAFDHLSNRLYVIQNIKADEDIKNRYEACEARAAELFDLIENSPLPSPALKKATELKVTSSMKCEEYAAMVRKAQEYILDGDIFQVVLSRRFDIENTPDPFSVYRVLRATNPSPYLYYLQSPEFCLTGASPEMLVNVENGVVTNKPIAGTSPRGADEAEDKKLEQELLSDEKERAEHTMLVDLGRNDVGKVCDFGTVNVSGFMHVERCSRVMHMVSEVRGHLRDDKTAFDALLSVLPAGTLSGAPKIRAMQIIDELEEKKRGVYGGAVGYMGFDGNMDTCITIRTALFRNGKAYVQAGAGIVADSVPEKEFAETANKAAAVLNAIKEASKL